MREVNRIREPLLPGGFHNIFVYKHSDGRVLPLTTVSGPWSHIYDLARVVDGASAEEALVGRVPGPDRSGGGSAYHDMYVGYHPTPTRTASTEVERAGTTSMTSRISRTRSSRSR